MHLLRTALAIASGAIVLTACASQDTRGDELLLSALQARLPGRYDNSAQVRADGQSTATPPHLGINLLIAPANAALIGKTVYYVRETEAQDPQHVLSQSIWVLGRTTDVHGRQDEIEQHVYLFKEPKRWIHVGDQPELLESMLPQDLQQLPGCELLWTRQEAVYQARRKSQTCSPLGRAEGVLLEQRIELRDNQLALQLQQVGADGTLDMAAAQPDPLFRFVRRGAAN